MNTVKYFKALSDSIRVRILHLIEDTELCVCNLSSILNMPQSSLSHHLALLKDAGYIESRKNGKWSYYKLNKFTGEDERSILLKILLENTFQDPDVIVDTEKKLQLHGVCIK